ncbi:MAG: DUF2634 domain-containing protein [Ruminiclostridium sp.]|nr:DUF2634 domain-containing protein [Ruminiclostridium sp.]
MIPVLGNEKGEFENFEIEEQPTLTYKMDREAERIAGTAEELEAVRQAVYKILQTERYEYPIYSGDYGIELKDLYGQPVSYVCPELERRICEALLWDSRIQGVENFEFDTSAKGTVRVSFRVNTVFGGIDSEKEVRI